MLPQRLCAACKEAGFHSAYAPANAGASLDLALMHWGCKKIPDICSLQHSLQAVQVPQLLVEGVDCTQLALSFTYLSRLTSSQAADLEPMHP